nr:tyrosine-type recombinase/integrase [Alkalispirochaeta alkalica]
MRGTKNTKATLRVTKEQELYRLAFAYDPAIVTLVRSRATSADDEAIITYVNQISSSGEYSSSYQNVAVNAIKFYTETVCGKSMPKIKLRPRREKKLPLILAESEVAAIIGALENTKHRAVISLIYSGGLRVSEAVNLKIQDFDRERGLIRIVQAKGKKDRQVPLSPRLWELLKRYRQEYQPRTWLFEGKRVASIRCEVSRLCSSEPVKQRGLPSPPRSTRCVIATLPTCWKKERTCGLFRSFWGTPAPGPPRFTPTSPPL